MPTTDAYLYGHATSDYRLRFSLTTGRNLVVMDVDEDGDDTLDPPPPDTAGAVTVPEFDNVTALGPLAGSVSGGGWTCPFAIAKYRADFAQYYGVEIQGTAYYSNSPLAPVTLFRGYMQDVNPARTAGSDITRFVAATSDRFLRDNALSYGIDWYLSADHIAPIAVADAIRHMLEAHTNLSPRSNINIGLPATDLYALATSAGDLAGIIKGIAGAVLPDAWFFFRRDDTAVATAHPNVAGESYPFPTPVVDFSDDMVYGIDAGPQLRANLVASVNLVAQTSDQDQITVVYPEDGAPGATGSRPTVTGLRYDLEDDLLAIAPLVYAHLNRRWRDVTITLGIIFKCDIGDLVTVTTSIPQRDIFWLRKKFVVTSISYAINQDERTLLTTIKLDECLL
jgi:hypothetical protein